MVSDAVGAKVLGKRSKGTLPAVSPIQYMENKAKSRPTSRRIPMPSMWCPCNGGPPRDLQADLQRTDDRFNGTL